MIIKNYIMTITYIAQYKLVTSHTGRRSFVTVNILRGYTIPEIMRATGHKSYIVFDR